MFILLAVGGGVFLYRWYNRHAVLVVPPPTVLVEDVQGRFLAEVSRDDKRRGFWPLPAVIPQRILEATLAAEDARFYEHSGVDWRSAGRALWQNLKRRRRVSGASTIAMQVARLQDPERRTYIQKAAQASVARGLIKRYGHDTVLRHYLLIAPYGNQYHGAVYASRRFFAKPLEDLTWAESALLAGLPKLPGRMNILHPNGRALAERRAHYVLTRLRTLGRITEAEEKEALELLPQLRIALPETRPRSGLHAAFAMEKELRDHPGVGGGDRYRVRSTLDLDLQEIVQLQAWNTMEKFRPEGAGSRVVTAPAAVPIRLAKDTVVELFSKGQIDVQAHLYKARSLGSGEGNPESGELVDANDDAYHDWNFRITRRLSKEKLARMVSLWIKALQGDHDPLKTELENIRESLKGALVSVKCVIGRKGRPGTAPNQDRYSFLFKCLGALMKETEQVPIARVLADLAKEITGVALKECPDVRSEQNGNWFRDAQDFLSELRKDANASGYGDLPTNSM